MEFNMLYLVGCVVSFIAIMTGIIIYKTISGEGIDFSEVFPIVCVCVAVSAIWFIVIPILVLSCVSFLLSKLIIKLSSSPLNKVWEIRIKGLGEDL